MKKVAVTGATGYIAEALIRRLLADGFEINAIARNESKLVALKSKFSQINIFPCPVEDYCLMKKAVRDCEGIFHLASLKDVLLSAENTLKTVQSNVIGTMNVLKLSTENKEIKYVLALSSDKAVKISSVYGATKFLMENLFREFEMINSLDCKYRVLRIGNVMYSSSSVLEKWKYSLLNGREIILTEPKATRFFWTREEVSELILECLEKAPDARPYLPRMKSVSMGDLLDLMIHKYGNGKHDVKIIGLQKGENLHEFISEEKSSFEAERWTKEELLNIL
jgi:UDP-N-acetylglucosamine 4,6-dehydratase/UDP-glucose 4-epimerase